MTPTLHGLLVSISFTSMLTAMFSLRFRAWGRPKLLAAYFTFFFVVEWTAQALFLPPGALGIEVAYVCTLITVLFVGAIQFAQHLERTASR
ncbi:MAG: hypothetical protein V3V08_04625 [Nannocystaceae bacterium]